MEAEGGLLNFHTNTWPPSGCFVLLCDPVFTPWFDLALATPVLTWPCQIIDADGSGTLHVTELVQASGEDFDGCQKTRKLSPVWTTPHCVDLGRPVY